MTYTLLRFSFLLLFFMPLTVCGQQINFSNGDCTRTDTMVLFAYWENHCKLIVPGLNAADLKLRIRQNDHDLALERRQEYGNELKFSLRVPDASASVEIKVYNRSANRLIKSLTIVPIVLSLPIAVVGTGDTVMGKHVLLAQQGIIMKNTIPLFKPRSRVWGYQYEVSQNGVILGSGRENSPYFSSELYRVMKELRLGGIIRFTEIKVGYPPNYCARAARDICIRIR